VSGTMVVLVATDNPYRRAIARMARTFLEQPALRLTLAQAQRLWGLDERTARACLDELKAQAFLVERARHYCRCDLDSGLGV
jgi:Fic family protein